jgi:hypothetical protein
MSVPGVEENAYNLANVFEFFIHVLSTIHNPISLAKQHDGLALLMDFKYR